MISKADQLRAMREARAVRSQSPAKPRATGMPRGEANAGGGHEVTSAVPMSREKALRKVKASLKAPAHIEKRGLPEDQPPAGVAPSSKLSGHSNSDHPFRKPLAKDAHKTLAATKPWEAEGMSRRTWYRRQKEKAYADKA